jgi:hypothetical protein
VARTGWRVLLLLALALAGCTSAPHLGEVAATLPPPGKNARLFIYRDLDIAQDQQWVRVTVNGAEIGGVGPGNVIVCDLPPGLYTIAPRTEYLWPDQAKSVRVAAGQTVYAKVGSAWTTGSRAEPVRLAALRLAQGQLADSTVNPGPNLEPIFVVMLQDPATGGRETGALWYAPCNPPYAPR